MTSFTEFNTTLMVLFCLIYFNGCTLILPSQRTRQALLAVKEAVYDFRYAGPSQVIAHDFVVSNDGDQPVSLTGLSACCGCNTDQVSSPVKLAPGQIYPLHLECMMPRYEGPVEKVTGLLTDKSQLAPVPLIIQGTIVREMRILPEVLSFGSLKKGATAEKEFQMLQISSAPLDITRIDAAPDLFSVNIFRFDEENHHGYAVAVRLSSKLIEPGFFIDVITVHTSDPMHPRIDVPVLAQIMK